MSPLNSKAIKSTEKQKNEMNITEIKNSIIVTVKAGLGKIKDIYKLPFFKTYLLLSVVMTFIFFIFTFPYDIIIRQHLQKLEKKAFQNIFIQNMDISFIGDSFFENIYVTFKNGSELSIRQILANLSLNPYSLLFSNTFKGDLQVSSIKYASLQMSVEGNINGNIDVSFNPKSGAVSDGTIKLMTENVLCKFDNMTLPDSMGGISLPPVIKISSIQIDTEIANNKMIIKQFLISGTDIRGTISGNIIMAPIFANSKLDLSISLDPESTVFAEFKPLLSSFIDNKGKITIPLKGTFSRPRASMKGEPADMRGESPMDKRDPLNLKFGQPDEPEDPEDVLNMKMN